MRSIDSPTRSTGTGVGHQAVSVSMVIPALGWDAALQNALEHVVRFCSAHRYDYEVIVVVDGCPAIPSMALPKDLSEALPHLRVIHHTRRMGKGFAVRTGILAASKHHVVYTDVDLAVSLDELETFLREIERGFDIVIASRRVAGAEVIGRPMQRRLMTGGLNWLVRQLLFQPIRDTQCGFKCLRRTVGQDVCRQARLRGFGFDIELLGLAMTKGYRIAELPVRYMHQARSTVRPMRDSFGVFADVLRLAFWQRMGRSL